MTYTVMTPLAQHMKTECRVQRCMMTGRWCELLYSKMTLMEEEEEELEKKKLKTEEKEDLRGVEEDSEEDLQSAAMLHK